ncbi:MAG: hypothetical protein ACK456_17525 [Pseudanabaenaceae cyanobacterium]
MLSALTRLEVSGHFFDDGIVNFTENFPMTRSQRLIKFLITVNTLLYLVSSIGLKLDLIHSPKETPLTPPSQTSTK